MAEHNPARRRRRRGRSWFVGLVMLASGGVGAYEAARWVTRFTEERTLARVETALRDSGADWATAAADGLTVRLSGTAPDDLQHVRAVSVATEAAGVIPVDDRIETPRPAEAEPPPFRFEVLRNEHGTSIIGLAPSSMDRRAVITRLTRADGAGALTDLLELAEHPAPEGWDTAVAFALAAAEQLPRAKIAVTPGEVRIDAVTDGAAEKARIERTLAATVPDGITLTTDIAAPRPVIAPFMLDLIRTVDGTRLARCAADSDPARDRILGAAAEAGAADAECAVGLGAPSPQWTDAALAGIAALDALPLGRLTLSELKVTLTAPHKVDRADFDAARNRLAEALPPSFALEATQAPAPPDDEDMPVRFVATVTELGVELRGVLADPRMGEAVASFAAARFGPVDSALTMDDDAPPGWTARVLAALESMGGLERGSVTVTPDHIGIRGTTGSPTAAQQIADQLAARLEPGTIYELALTYDPRLDPAVDTPSGTECIDALNATMLQSEIGFEPNRDVIAGDVEPVMKELAATMARCGNFRIEVGGHTDSQGSDSFNRELSQMRAQAVIEAMAAAGIGTTHLTATGYGESRPVASNDDEMGREANRRIEFRLLSPNPVDTVTPAATLTRGVVGGPPPAPVPGTQTQALPPKGQVGPPETGAPPLALAPPTSQADGSSLLPSPSLFQGPMMPERPTARPETDPEAEPEAEPGPEPED